jgi:hypothetical protein
LVRIDTTDFAGETIVAKLRMFEMFRPWNRRKMMMRSVIMEKLLDWY